MKTETIDFETIPQLLRAYMGYWRADPSALRIQLWRVLGAPESERRSRVVERLNRPSVCFSARAQSRLRRNDIPAGQAMVTVGGLIQYRLHSYLEMDDAIAVTNDTPPDDEAFLEYLNALPRVQPKGDDAMSERILDTAAFPIVRGRSDGLSEGYSARWISELEHILSREEPFVLLYVDHQADEAHSDQKARSIWLKNNRARMGEFCRGLIAVEPDAQLRAKPTSARYSPRTGIRHDRSCGEKRAGSTRGGAGACVDRKEVMSASAPTSRCSLDAVLELRPAPAKRGRANGEARIGDRNSPPCHFAAAQHGSFRKAGRRSEFTKSHR